MRFPPRARQHILTALAAPLVAAALTAQLDIHPDELKLKPQIDAAIAQGVEHILDNQRRDGSWSEGGNYAGGRTGLCVYALLKSGVRMDHPALHRAFAFLDHVEPDKTYATACMMLAYEATGDEKYRPKMRRLLARLVDWQARAGNYGYPHGADLSNTQYAALGLWAANKAGLKVPNETWTKLIEGTLKHQEDLHYVDVKVGKKTGVTKRQVAGFEYRPSRRAPPRKATGTMTTAGVSILKICEIGLGKRLRRRDRQELTQALEAGLNWLDVHFSVQHPQIPGKRGRWLHYYLYGMERVGALTRREQFGEHWWYLEGARLLLKQQKKGSWGRAIHDTCFALLFLRRATNIGATTGASGVKSRHLFSAGSANDDIALRGAGQQPLMLYINGFGKPLLQEHAANGLRILRVEYLLGKRKLGELSGDPTKAWQRDTFLHRCTSLSHGTHKIVARVIALAPDAPNGETDNTVTLESKPMEVRIRDVIEPWMAGIAEMQDGSVMREGRPKVTASSNQKTARNLVDGLDATHWRADPKDETPTLTFEFARPVVARRLLLSQALNSTKDLARTGVIEAVEISFNRSRREERIELSSNPLAPTEYELPRPLRLREFTLRIVQRAGKANLPVGFAEVVISSSRGDR